MSVVKLDSKIDPNALSEEEKLNIISGIVKKLFSTSTADKYDVYPLKLDHINIVQHYISKVRLDEDILIPVSCYDNPFIMADMSKVNGVTVSKTLYLQNPDPEKFNSIYSKASGIISTLTSVMKTLPSDLDRIIFANEYLVANTTYNKTSYGSGRGGCLLALKQGMCSGFADAFDLLMHFSGVKTYDVSAAKMNHGWNYVEVDGELYHVDCCWNNTKSKSDKLQHRYLLLSDEKIKKVTPTHYSFDVFAKDRAYNNPKLDVHATSKRFDNWWVHDVKGRMYFFNGLWYYHDTVDNTIKANNALGTNEKTILKLEDKSITSFEIEGGFIKLKL